MSALKSLDYKPVYFTKSVYQKAMDSITPFTENASLNAPGLSNVIFAPINWCSDFFSIYKSKIDFDMEGILDATCKFLSSNFSIPNAFLNVDVYLSGTIKALHSSLLLGNKTALFVLDCGLLVCLLETIYHGIYLKRSHKFLKKEIFAYENLISLGLSKKVSDKLLFIDKFLKVLKDKKDIFKEVDVDNLTLKLLSFKKRLKEDPASINSMEFSDSVSFLYKRKIKNLKDDYFTLSDKEMVKVKKKASKKNIENQILIDRALVSKKTNLARRVRPWMVMEIDETLPQIEKGLSDSSTKEDKKLAIGKSQKLFIDMKTQARKLYIGRIIGILALGIITPLGLFMGFYFAHAGISMAFSIFGCLSSFGRYLFVSTCQDRRGWNFALIDAFPNFLKPTYLKVKNIFLNFKQNYLCLSPSLEKAASS
jgi:hypothetical protein